LFGFAQNAKPGRPTQSFFSPQARNKLLRGIAPRYCRALKNRTRQMTLKAAIFTNGTSVLVARFMKGTRHAKEQEFERV
jgi:hypothetical protein